MTLALLAFATRNYIAARRQAAADREIEGLVGKTEAPEDPPPIEIPEPIPDGDDPFTEGKDPAGTETRER